MLLTITNTQAPATNLGYLLHKNPARMHSRDLPFGAAHVFYPEATEASCTAVLLLEVDPVGLVRGRSGPPGEGGLLEQYVNDRPYVASSFLSVALGQVFSTALSGRCKDKPELVDAKLPLTLTLPVVPCRGGESFLRGLFEPLGYSVNAERLPLDSVFPEWGESACFRVALSGEHRLRDALSHIYVLVPVLDADKHYWVGDDEVEKLLRRGKGWLESHPEKEEIANRYLKRRRRLTRMALARLAETSEDVIDETETKLDQEEETFERPISLNEQRHATVFEEIKICGALRVADLGCGEGKLLRRFLEDKQFSHIAGVDVSTRALELAADRLRLDTMPDKRRERLHLFQSSLTYLDERLKGFDAACAVEVIEHLEPERLVAFERALFDFAQPRVVVITTPNVAYNVRFPTLQAGRFRHRDHRFEWTRAQFEAWANAVAARNGYQVRFRAIGPSDEEVGSPTQMAVFER